MSFLVSLYQYKKLNILVNQQKEREQLHSSLKESLFHLLKALGI